MDKFSYISNATPEYIENLYHQWQNEPSSVDDEFQKFFEGFEFATANFKEGGNSISLDEFKVLRLINAYRKRGHLESDTNPIRQRKDRGSGLSLERHGLTDKDLERTFQAGSIIGIGPKPLKEIIDHLDKCYCGTLGFEFNYIKDSEEKLWFRNKIENNPALVKFSKDKKMAVLEKLTEAVGFEQFLGIKYVGQKRFSLEGGETTMPGLDAILEKSATLDTEEVVIGMAHRGRLNVLANLMGKTYEEIFSEFEDSAVEVGHDKQDGDVKYHLGFSSTYTSTEGKEMTLQLAPNPSHLEAVDPVVTGYARAKQDDFHAKDRTKVMPILIHGDAAVAGQGVVYEVLQMEKLEGFATGGTIHWVINNQIGFTTDFYDARSSDYCTSIAATVHAPVIHVNGDDIEAVIFAAETAAEYRHKFGKDIFIDMVCYRKHGHNESDDPSYTQPTMYKTIKKHKNPRDIYIKKLIDEGDIDAATAKGLEKDFKSKLQERLDMVKEQPKGYKSQAVEEEWAAMRKATAEDFEQSVATGIGEKTAKVLIEKMNIVPEGFSPVRKMVKYLNGRNDLLEGDKMVDWAGAELLAYGSILNDGNNVRMTGQDVKRGTFSHRHAVIVDENDDRQYNRLSEVAEKQGEFRIFNSHLSEYGVLGFEFGYSMVNPKNLVIWEAQFGDFANTAQVIFDQFISSSESKWNRNCGLVMLLPHGYEGQGPEHSSARLERYLGGCAEFNTYICNITTPANLFHAMRRQIATPYRKPLVVMSPKSLLRHPDVMSPLEEIIDGQFKELIDDVTVKDAKKVKRMLFCSGKVYFDLLNYKQENKRDDIAIVRLEQLYPLPLKQIDTLINEKYKGAEFYWVQEEPMNMGAWNYILNRFHKIYGLDKYPIHCVSRKTKASPATGYKKQHEFEQADLVKRAFN